MDVIVVGLGGLFEKVSSSITYLFLPQRMLFT